MDIQKILEEYQQKEVQTPLFKLQDGRLVVGTVIDENNHTFYVVQDGNILTIEDSQDVTVTSHLFPKPQARTVKVINQNNKVSGQ